MALARDAEARAQAANLGKGEAQLADEQRWRERWYDEFIQDNLWVPPYDGGKPVPFVFTPGQNIVATKIHELRQARRKIRLCVLKSRKQGISAYAQAGGYGYTSTRDFVNGLLITHKKETSQSIFELTQKYWLMDERRAIGSRPPLELASRGTIKFGNPDPRTRSVFMGLQSKLEITSAEAKEPGRSGTYHFVHASEVAFWEDSGVWAAAGSALMDGEDSVAIMESTANGTSGLFYETYQDALAGKNEWTPVFLSWLMDPRCRRPLDSGEQNRWEWENIEEREYAERYGLTLQQSKFRRVCLHDPKMKKAGKAPVDVFDEEFPATEDIAFKSSGTMFFLASTLEALRKHPTKGERPPIWRGHIRNKESLEKRGPHNPSLVIDPVLTADAGGPLRVWEEPRDDTEYVIGADVAEGLLHGDNHAVCVLRRDNLDFVALWKTNRTSSRELAWAACLLGWRYGGRDRPALIGIELNAAGLAANQEAMRILYPYLWHHQDVRVEGSEPQGKVGWVTSEAVRTYMLSAIEFEIQDGTLGIHSEEFYSEAQTFEKLGNPPKPQARSGKKDDEILASAITLQMHLHSGPPMRVPDKPKPATRARVLVPDFPEQGKVPIASVPERIRRVAKHDMWGFD